LKTIRTETAGSLSQIDYDIMVRDLVNFMTWMSEPNQLTRKQVGYVVMLVLLVLLVLTYFLYKEFWKDVHREKPSRSRGALGARAFFICPSLRLRRHGTQS